MNFRTKRLTPQIVHLIFNSGELMCKTMCRMAEHFESPKYRGKTFTWRQFKSWYKFDKGEFSYYTDWAGFNMPGITFDAFKAGKFDPLTWGEKDVLEAIKDMKTPFYLITSGKDTEGAIRHEMGHAFYYVDDDYCAKAKAILAKLPQDTNKLLKEGIKLQGYHDDVLDDELHAYMIDGIRYLTRFTETRDRFPWLQLPRYVLAQWWMNRLLDETMDRHNVED